MDFSDIIKEYYKIDINKYFDSITKYNVMRTLRKEKLDELDFLTLISPQADEFLEEMAKIAHSITKRHFGKTILLYTPMYLSNYCINGCMYCGYNAKNSIKRMKLGIGSVIREAEEISKTGIRHILLLTGESRSHTPPDYIAECVDIIKKYFSSISIEVYPLETDEYKHMISKGVDGLTIYQEVYDKKTYSMVHEFGPKKDYYYRLNAPERGCIAGMRNVNIGALLGLADPVKEFFFTGLHANYLVNKYPDVEISVSLPRLRPHNGSFQPPYVVSDKQFVKFILAIRLFINRIGITISTREDPTLRENLIPLGVTKMSAGSSTKVGGHSLNEKSDGQFEVSDERSVEEIKNLLYQKGYQPVFKDWQVI